MTMTTPSFASLDTVPLREAWMHEALHFTPWLAANLDRLAQAIGIPLELTGTEAGVGPFSADILARNPMDDSVVLIENQLEASDHTHLGQIMTYLAGLKSHTMVWVAPTFREEHLSAIRWLNEHTVDPFAFFAVRLRVVRIADSPFAPLFEVIERPNNWDRNVAEQKREAEGNRTEIGQRRFAFWSHFCARHPGDYGPDAASSRWLHLPGTDAKLVQYLAQKSVGVFVRPDRGGDAGALRDTLAPYAEALAQRLVAGFGDGKYLLGRDLMIDTHNRANWDRMADWLDEQGQLTRAAFTEILGASE